ncbi:MAG: hypothetical protein ACYDC2_02770 [Solirubrobacteraceae bacterium]
MSELRVAGAAPNQPQAELMVMRLAEVGIHAVMQIASGNPEFGASTARWVYVEERDLERARALLAGEQPPISDEELARLSDEAGREAREPG